MAEIVDDLKISNVEITSELGINFTNDITRIKHTGNDEFNISSSGEINIRTEKKSNGNDCDINLYTGDGQDVGGSEEGGDIYLICGNGAGNEGSGGDIIINAGDGVTGIGGGRGGYINIYAGDGGDDYEGGNISIHAGNGVTGNADGGYLEIYAGNGNDEGGYIEMYAGNGNDDDGGYIQIKAGNGITGNADGGYLQIYAGNGNDDGGYIQMYAGEGNENNGGYIEIKSGNGITGNADGGDIEITAGEGYQNGGSINIRCGNSGVNNSTNTSSAGSLNIYAGDSYGQDASAGSIYIASGDSESTGTNSYAGDLYIQAGNSDNAYPGFLGIYGGDGAIYGGSIRIEAGTKYGSNNYNGAPVEIYGGDVEDGVTGTGTGGSVIIGPGKSEDHKYGDIIIGTLNPAQTPTAFGNIYISGDPRQKIGFFGNTPVVRPTDTGITGSWNQNGGSEVRNESSFTGGIGNKAYTIGDIVRALKQLGLLDDDTTGPSVARAPIDALQTRVDKPKKAKQVKIERNKTDKTKATDKTKETDDE
jgi:hypothetical protein